MATANMPPCMSVSRELLERHESDVDAAPLRLMSDVFLMGARENGPAFEW